MPAYDGCARANVRAIELVEDDEYMLALTRYIHLNPVKIAACRRMGREGRLARLDAELADMSSRAVGEHYGMDATAVAANHCRLTARPELVKVVEKLSAQLRKGKRKTEWRTDPRTALEPRTAHF